MTTLVTIVVALRVWAEYRRRTAVDRRINPKRGWLKGASRTHRAAPRVKARSCSLHRILLLPFTKRGRQPSTPRGISASSFRHFLSACARSRPPVSFVTWLSFPGFEAGLVRSTSNPGRSRSTFSLPPRSGERPKFFWSIVRASRCRAPESLSRWEGARPGRGTPPTRRDAASSNLRLALPVRSRSSTRDICPPSLARGEPRRTRQASRSRCSPESRAASWTRLANLWPASRSAGY
jgi:hypothetical protein